VTAPDRIAPPAPEVESSASLTAEFAVPGFIGTTLMAVGSLGVGWVAPASGLATTPLLDQLRANPALAFTTKLMVILGVALLLQAWLRLGHHVRTHRVTEPRALSRLVWWWSAPLVLAPALFSRDLFSYVAHSRLLPQGIDPYLYGTGVLNSWYSDGADAMWTSAPAPYGPLWMGLSTVVYWVTGAEPTAALVAFRLLALAGVGLIAVYLPRLAERCGADPAKALWLGLLNPLLLMHFVSAGHNDALMTGLLVAGLALALEGRRLAGVVVVALAGAVKAPGLVGVPFAALAWADNGRAPLRRRVRAWVLGGLTTLGTFLALNLGTGLGFGWVGSLGTPGLVRTWLSPTTALGMLTGNTARVLGAGDWVDAAVQVFRGVGTVATLGLLTWLVLTAGRRNLARGLGLALLAVVVLGPVVQPWYLLWGLVVLAGSGLSRSETRAAALLTIGFVVYSIANTGATVDTYGELSDGLAVLLSVVGVFALLAASRSARALLRDAEVAPPVPPEPAAVTLPEGRSPARHR
jgi:hypothetical protein